MATGRLTDFCRWLYERAPTNAASTHHGYCSTIRAHFKAKVNWEFIYTPLLSRYFSKSAKLSRDRMFRDPAMRRLLTLVYCDGSIPLGARTAIVLAWNGLLRVSEYIADTDWSLPAKRPYNLMAEDVERFSTPTFEGFRVKIKRQKTDAYNQSMWQYYARRPGDILCPVTALEAYRAVEPLASTPGMPLFVRRGCSAGVPAAWTPVSRSDLNQALKKWASSPNLSPDFISTHSLRVGGAFQMASAGCSIELIQIRGRWSARGSNEIALMYTRMDSERVRVMSEAMRSGDPSLLGRH